MPERNVVEAINNALHEEMERDPRVMVLGLWAGWAASSAPRAG